MNLAIPIDEEPADGITREISDGTSTGICCDAFPELKCRNFQHGAFLMGELLQEGCCLMMVDLEMRWADGSFNGVVVPAKI